MNKLNELWGRSLKMKNLKLAAVLALCLTVAILFAFCVDSIVGISGTAAQNSNYNITISEICTKNETIIADGEGDYRDYIELYNGGDTVNLAGFTLTDGKHTSTPFGEIIMETGEYRVFFLGDEVTGFSLGAAGGDCIQLRDPAGNVVVQANTTALRQDQVMLYGSYRYWISYDASPGFPNTSAGVAAFREGKPAKNPALIVSEVLIGNISSLPDEHGMFCDVVEIHNVSDHAVYLGNYFLSDDLQQRFRFRLPDRMLPADGYLVVYCDGQNYIGPKGHTHAGFGLTHGETLVLTDHLGFYTSVSVSHEGDDISLSLNDEGNYEAGWVSLGFANNESGIANYQASIVDPTSPLVISELLLSSACVPYDNGFYDVVEIWNRSGKTVSTAGWFLSDGGEPYAWPLPEQQLEPGECLIVPCSPQTTGFGLSEGEVLRLMGPSYLYAPVVACVALEPGVSISLLNRGTDYFYEFSKITLGYENTKENHRLYMQENLPEEILISEVMSANCSYLKGSYATTCDWVELYNNSAQAINLSEYCLSDDPKNLQGYALPDRILRAGEYCVIFLNRDTQNLLDGYPVLPFGLSSEGDQLYLSRGDVLVDYVQIPGLPTDVSYGRAAGSPAFSMLNSVTPGWGNGTAAAMSAMPTAVTPQGIYDDVSYVEVVLSGEGDIYYTTDATAPGAAALRYTNPIRLEKTTVIRAVCREPGKMQSEALNLTYVINENDELDVVCLVTNPDNLWSDQSGIYVNGPGMSPDPPYYGANFWKDWERPATLSLFEEDGNGFSINCGIKIFGAFTRSLPKKSLACMFRDCYGDSELAYPIFGENSLDTYESIILRSAGQDSIRARMRDVVITSLVGDATDIPVQQYRPVIVYLNGEYWGLHYIREKLNENYVAGHYNVSADTVTVVENTGWYNQEYQSLLKYVLGHDMREQEHYDYICSQIDIDNYIDFYIAQIWIANTDKGNVKYYKIEGEKWKWFLYDTDLSFGKASLNTVQDNLKIQSSKVQDISSRTFASRMMANEEFREKFLTRFAWQMNNIWTEENVIARIDEVEAMIRTDMIRDCKRWNYEYKTWESNVEHLREFARTRNEYVLSYIRGYFDLTDEEMRSYGFDV